MPLVHSAHCTLPSPRSEVRSALAEPARRASWWVAAPAEKLGAPSDACSFAWPCCGIPSRVELRLSDDEVGANTGDASRAMSGTTRIDVVHTLERELDVARAAEWLDDFWRLALGNLGAHLRHGADIALPRLDAVSGGAAARASEVVRPIRLALA